MSDNLVYKRILLKLSGEALAGEKKSGIDFDYVLSADLQRLLDCISLP